MKNVKTFTEFASITEAAIAEGGYMSENMIKQCEAMCEAMCNEMKACHADETEKTAENYKSECNEKLSEMMKTIENACNEYMSA